MMRVILRVIAVLIAGWAAVGAYYAMWFRMEGSSELRMIEEVDLDIGGMFALAFVLFFAPGRIRAPKAWLLTAIGAASIWICVSGGLIHRHREQHRFRSHGIDLSP
jgi:hypothetical protein